MFTLENGSQVVMVVIYISLNKKMNDIMFINKSLTEYNLNVADGSATIITNFHVWLVTLLLIWRMKNHNYLK